MNDHDAQVMADSRPANPFDDPEYVKMREERQREYETNELLDRELAISVPEAGGDVYLAARADLEARGIHPDEASQEQLAAALRRCS